MKATLILGDCARVAEGKLDILGGGWSTLRAAGSHAIGLLLTVPWLEQDEPHLFSLALTDERGQIVVNDGEPLFKGEGTFGANRDPNVLLGGPATLPMAINVPALPLRPGARYKYVLTIDGLQNPEWELPFAVAPSGGAIAA